MTTKQTEGQYDVGTLNRVIGTQPPNHNMTTLHMKARPMQTRDGSAPKSRTSRKGRSKTKTPIKIRVEIVSQTRNPSPQLTRNNSNPTRQDSSSEKTRRRSIGRVKAFIRDGIIPKKIRDSSMDKKKHSRRATIPLRENSSKYLSRTPQGDDVAPVMKHDLNHAKDEILSNVGEDEKQKRTSKVQMGKETDDTSDGSTQTVESKEFVARNDQNIGKDESEVDAITAMNRQATLLITNERGSKPDISLKEVTSINVGSSVSTDITQEESESSQSANTSHELTHCSTGESIFNLYTQSQKLFQCGIENE